MSPSSLLVRHALTAAALICALAGCSKSSSAPAPHHCAPRGRCSGNNAPRVNAHLNP
jgi:hypothetical protein